MPTTTAISITLDDRESYTLATWLTEAEHPKGLSARRNHLATIQRLDLDHWVDEAQPTERCSYCGGLKRKGFREVPKGEAKTFELDEQVARYLLGVLDSEDKAMGGNGNLILLPVADRIRAALTAPAPA